MTKRILLTTTPALSLTALLLAGCATSNDHGSSSGGSTSGAVQSHYRSTDRRNVDIGNNWNADSGRAFKEPHMDKCWIADGFNFKGYDVLYIAPTASTATMHDDEKAPHETSKQALPQQLRNFIQANGPFPRVVLQESEIKPGEKVARMENTIVQYAKGGGAARYWAGIYGAGQPILKVQGRLTDAGKPLFTYEATRSGTSGGARMFGAFMKDEDIQIQDIQSMALDISDFMGAVSGKYEVR
jgi:hypothetical protein